MPTDNHEEPRLPDFKPRGMGKWDKIAAWSLAFIVILFGLGFVNNHYMTHSAATPVPTTSATAKAKVPPKVPTQYVVENIKNGYIWWLDPVGNKFTKATAKTFAKQHPLVFRVYIIQPDP
jgi:hypothetical protein